MVIGFALLLIRGFIIYLCAYTTVEAIIIGLGERTRAIEYFDVMFLLCLEEPQPEVSSLSSFLMGIFLSICLFTKSVNFDIITQVRKWVNGTLGFNQPVSLNTLRYLILLILVIFTYS